MASLHKDKKNGGQIIQFFGPDRRRRTVRLSGFTKKDAETARRHIEELNKSNIIGCAPKDETAHWVAKVGDVIADKLADVGLIPARNKQATTTLDGFIESYIAGRTDIKPLTHRNLKAAQKCIVDYFGQRRSLASITPGDADDFRRKLLETLGDNTVRRICGRARQFFRVAVRKRLIHENPFGDMKNLAVRGSSPERECFITAEMTSRLIEAAPDAEWRAIIALARYGGLRVPSELLRLKWSHIDWHGGRMLVESPKTEGHEGHESRLIPLYPELRKQLEEAYDLAEVGGSEFVVARYRDANVNLRTQLHRIIKRAGLEPWEKIFHNLRASRQTELSQVYAEWKVCRWMGNSQSVGRRHYLQLTDADYQDAAGALHEALQQGAQLSVTGGKGVDVTPSNCAPMHSIALGAGRIVPPRGVEPLLPD